jgi:predicted  nucleic acid-binding Zn-ribbon protein
MAIPRASIPQASMQQAQPLLAQFNAARAAAQGQQMPVIQGRGIDPAQLMQMAQGNALQIRNQLNGQANQFIATDPAVDIRARERYLESLEKDTQAANRADSRAIFNANKADARTIYSTENAKEAAALSAQQNDARLQRDIDNRNLNTDRRIEADDKRFERKVEQDEANRRAATNAEIELKEYEDELIRNRLADERQIAEAKQEALEGKFGPMIQKPILAYQNWQEYGKATRYEEYKTQFIQSKLQDPKYVQEYQSDARFGGKDFFGSGDQQSQNYFIGLAAFIRSKLEGGDPVLASGFAPYQLKLNQEEERLASVSAKSFTFALANKIPVDMNPGAQAGGPVTVPGGVQVQGNGAGGVPVGGGANPLTPNVPVAPGSLPAFKQQEAPPPPEEESSADPLTTAILTSTGAIATNEALRQTPVDVDKEFAKAKPNQADLDQGTRRVYEQMGDTKQQKQAIQEVDDKLSRDTDKINKTKELAKKNIATAESQIKELEKQSESLKKKIQDKSKKYNKFATKLNTYGEYSPTEQREFKQKMRAIQDDIGKLTQEMNQKAGEIDVKKQGITRKKDLLGQLDKSLSSRKAKRPGQVGAIRKDQSLRSTNISNQRSTVNADPDLKETAQRQGKLNALIRQKGMNPDDFRMSNGLLDEAAMRDHIGAKKEFAISKLARRFPDLAKRIAGLAKGRIGSNLLIATITGGTAYALLSREDKKEAETQLKEVKDLEEIEAELNATQSTQPNALQPAQ